MNMSCLDNYPWREIFFQEDFSVDQCLTKLTENNLDTLKSHLKNYGDELHRQMAEILKTETEAIVNLAEYLTNLNTKIDNLSVSLSQLREELKVLYNLIKNAEIEYRKTLDDKRMNDMDKNCMLARLHFISITLYVDNMLRTIVKEGTENIIDLERIVYTYSFQRNYLAELGIVTINNTIIGTENKLLSMVNKHFLRGIENADEDTIIKCLRMYSNLDKEKEAEEFYQVNVVRPYLLPMYTEKSLDKFNQDVNQIYSEILNFMNSDMKILEGVLLRHTDLKKSFNFVLKSFWVEVDKQCRNGLPHITAPGNPELFQKRYISTWNLLLEIAQKCGSENLLKTNPLFQNHLRRFNLPVYFEIRFQQIASQFETDILIRHDDNSIFIGGNDFGFKLKITLDLYVALKKCFDDHVFINQLADHFLKFSLFLLSRYMMWFQHFLDQANNETNWESFLMSALVDMKSILHLLGNRESLKNSDSIYAIFPKEMQTVIVKVIDNNEQFIKQFFYKLSNHLVSLKATACSEQLQNVTAIPRLFRRTNRSPPKEASLYMVEAIKPILQFNNEYSLNDINILNPVIEKIIMIVIKQYSTLVQDVLQSVCKTEESLRRLKSRNTTASDDSLLSLSPETMTDETKIREQIKLDINYFINKLSQIGTLDSKDALDNLKKTMSRDLCSPLL